MNISVKEIKPCRRHIRVELSAAEVAQRFECFWAEFGRKARVPGFRVGKAPREVLEKRFAAEARNEVVQDLVSKSYVGALREKGVRPVANPEISGVKFKDGESLQYEAQVDVRPEFKLRDYTGLPIKRKKVEMTETEVNEALEALRKRHAQYIDAGSRPLVVTDFVVVDYRCIIEDKTAEERKNLGLEVGSKDILPSLQKGLIGMTVGQTKKIDMDFPKDIARKEWAGKKGVFEVTLKEIKEARLPKLDDDFAKDLGQYKSLDDLRKSITENGLSHKKQLQRDNEWSQIVEQLLKRFSFDIPESVRVRQEENMWQDMQQRLMRNGWSKEKIEEEAPKVREKLRAESVQGVRIAYIMNAIAEKEGIRAEESEITQRVQEWARSAGIDPKEIKQRDKDNQLVQQFADRIINEKVIALLIEKANIKQED